MEPLEDGKCLRKEGLISNIVKAQLKSLILRQKARGIVQSPGVGASDNQDPCSLQQPQKQDTSASLPRLC